MKLSINLRNWGPYSTRELVREFARAVDESGLDTVWVNERLALPPNASPDMPTYSPTGRTLDPLATLAFLAAVTQRIGLGTAVLNLPFRPALLTAKWVATLQDLSGGRVQLGIGTGWMETEFRALGLDPKRRGALTDETLAVLQRCFQSDVVEVNGQSMLFQPRPPRPPIYVGGKPPHALRRALRFGDGWIPAGIEPDALKPGIAQLRGMCQEAGRPALEVIAMKTLPLADLPRAIDYAQQFQHVGVTHLVHTQGYETVAEYRRVIALLEEHIRPALG
ncbi:MAG TPA: TIGR03619 family F420-dependent LLM class oxidoreductase [Candidatus Binatia bacterium]|nr:TIGR03619 family F420-dependent LLM class oxidoreductase [Candidatus Binatia bacterium]